MSTTKSSASPTTSETSQFVTSITSTITTVTTTTASDTYSPTQPGLSSNCDKFHLVTSGDQCAAIEVTYSISASQFSKWNPFINKDCTNLWLDYYVCVHVPGATTLIPSKPTSTDSGNGIHTPLPTQPQINQQCNKFYYVKKGDFCDDIAFENRISVHDFLRWNPSAGSGCTGLWADSYACVDVLADFSVASRFHGDCTGDVHNRDTFDLGSNGHCVNTDCDVGSLEIASEGACPHGAIRISYWEQPGCGGKWFGYGYGSRGQCRTLWSGGNKFKSLWLKCASKESDCLEQGTCAYDTLPNYNLC